MEGYARESWSHRAAPNGLPLAVPEVGGVGPIFGEERGLAVTEAVPVLGSNSSFRRAS